MTVTAEAVVLTVNPLAAEDEPGAVRQERAASMCDARGDIPLGLRECPGPHHRKLSPEPLRWATQGGRFRFLNDTCCRDAIAAEWERGFGNGVAEPA